MHVFMKKMGWVACLCVGLCACNGQKKHIDPFAKLTEEIDSISAAATDSICVATEEEEAEEALPATADESFADFFYNFALDERLQRARIVFPLPYYKGEEKSTLSEEEWTYDPMFSRDESYTVLFDTPEEMEMEKDTSLVSVKVELIYLQTKQLKRYYFQRTKGIWRLEAIDLSTMPHDEEERENFFDFYARFATDSTFQYHRLRKPLKFVTADPDDEFEILETTIDPDQWSVFQPVLPREYLTNVNYGQVKQTASDTKIIEMKGFGNGFNNTLYFERRHGLWRLVQFEDLSD
jgi:hypothetical protein